MGVIDSSLNEGAVLIIKTFYDFENPDERYTNLGSQIIKTSVWTMQKASSLVNFNKAY